jgi:hypothetical protein
MERTSRLHLKESLYLEKERPELLCILGERDREIEDLTEEIDQASARLGYLEWLSGKQDDQLKMLHKILLGTVLFIITLLIILYERF